MINLRNIGIGIVAMGMISLTSCKDEEKRETTSPQTEMPASNSNTTAALNPAHGQPGHRCEIPVGAPLDGSSTTNTQTQPQMTTSNPTGTMSPVRVNNTNTGTSTGTAMKNPPHGQPGHDCAVPVGADLPQQ